MSWHLGPSFAISLGIVLWPATALFSKLRPALSRFRILTLLVLLGAVIRPLIVLTIDEAKSPVESGVVAPMKIVLLAVLCANAVFVAPLRITSARASRGRVDRDAGVHRLLAGRDGWSGRSLRAIVPVETGCRRTGHHHGAGRGWTGTLIFSDRLDAHITSSVFATAAARSAWECRSNTDGLLGKVTSVSQGPDIPAVDVGDMWCSRFRSEPIPLR